MFDVCFGFESGKSLATKTKHGRSIAPRLLAALLPRDLAHEGKSFTPLFRSHGKGGKVVMLENSLPGRSGHRFVVFKIDTENGREQFGEEIARPHALDRAIEIASQS